MLLLIEPVSETYLCDSTLKDSSSFCGNMGEHYYRQLVGKRSLVGFAICSS